MAQIVALVLVAQVASPTGPVGITSVKVGQFLSMDACREAATGAVTIDPHAGPTQHVGFVCVPLSPVSGRAKRE